MLTSQSSTLVFSHESQKAFLFWGERDEVTRNEGIILWVQLEQSLLAYLAYYNNLHAKGGNISCEDVVPYLKFSNHLEFARRKIASPKNSAWKSHCFLGIPALNRISPAVESPLCVVPLLAVIWMPRRWYNQQLGLIGFCGMQLVIAGSWTP